MPELGGEDLRLACQLLLEHYDRPHLEKLLRIRFNWRLELIVREASLTDQVGDLFEFACRHGIAGRLLREAADFPPPKERLRPLAERYFAAGAAEPPPPRLEDLVAAAIGGFEAAARSLEAGAAPDRLAPFAAAYQLAAARIEDLRRYKKLHDCLQLLQLRQREIERAAREVAVAELYEYADVLADAAAEARTVLGGLPNPGPEETWAAALARAADLLRTAAAGAADDGPKAARLLERLLERDPSRIHGLILRHSEAIPLNGLVFSLRELRGAPGGLGAAIAAGLLALETLQLRLGALVAEHTAWQNFDNSLSLAKSSWHEIVAAAGRPERPADGGPDGRPDGRAAEPAASESQLEYLVRLAEDWPDVAAKLEQIRLQPAVAPEALAGLLRYAADIGAAAAARNWGVVLNLFEPFAKLALRRFVEVDRRLLALVDELTRIGEPLRTIVQVIQP